MQPLQRSFLGDGAPRVDPSATVERVHLDDRSWVDVGRSWLHGADSLLDHLVEQVPWRQGRRRMYDRVVDDPRLSRWYGAGEALPHPGLERVRQALEHRYRVRLRGVGCNYYRHGRDSVAFHRDRELRHLDRTLVAIVTLGATRPFLIRPLGGGPARDVRPGPGDLLVMGGRCQADWEHSVPKVAHAGPRISASFRWSAGEGRPVVGDRRRRASRPADGPAGGPGG